jgi:hypothetical protein
VVGVDRGAEVLGQKFVEVQFARFVCCVLVHFVEPASVLYVDEAGDESPAGAFDGQGAIDVSTLG